MDPTVSVNPRTVDINATSFEANGKTYHKANSVSFQRWGWMERTQVELMYGRTPKEVFDSQKQAFDLLNKGKLAEAAVAIDGSMRGIAQVADGRLHAAFRLMLLFWNYEGEDVSIMTDELMEEKVEDMEASGIDVQFFFGQAFSNVPGLPDALKQLMGGSSKDLSGEK